MRPLRLEVEGFTVFREPTVVDFTDVDFFALVGPTGAGKSTLLDAICFALYGTVPRWADQRAVANALAPSSAEARVRLVFETAGVGYVATRVVSRDGKGRVKTSLAGLQRLPSSVTASDLADADEGSADSVLGEVLAATPKEMDTAVPGVLGLPYEHFVTCVILPQGEFAQFLHAKPSERGDILVNLLGLDVYRRIAERAGEVARESSAHADAAQRLLGTLGDVDQDTVDAAAARAAALRDLRDQVDAELPALAEAQRTAEEARHRLTELDTAVRALSAVAVPDDVASLSAQITEGATATGRAEQALADAEAAEDEARAAAEALPDPAELRQVLAAHDRLADLVARRDQLAADVTDAEARLATARGRAGQAAERSDAAEAEYAAAQRSELAGVLRPHLAVGQPCPVCTQQVPAIPEALDATELRAAEKALAEARAARETADRTALDAEKDLSTAAARLTDHDAGIAEAGAATADQDDRAEVAATADEAERLRATWRQASDQVRASRKRYQQARAAEERARSAATEAWTALDRARDALAEHHPPTLDRDQLDTAWSQLVAWAHATADQRAAERPAFSTAAADTEGDVVRRRDRLRELFHAHDVAVPDPADAAGLSTAVTVAVTQAASEHERLAERLDQAAKHRADLDRHAERARVAKALAEHLRANKFERWLLEEALDTLVEGASRILGELSGGQYSLDHSDGEFHVLDHHDADLRRVVRTLSGGETFQAALALALALSEQLAGLSSTPAALESIVLDEGFGTLDATTLETVAATLERLAARGDRMVGVVTHVPALAERIPVRYEVTKDAHSARVREAS